MADKITIARPYARAAFKSGNRCRQSGRARSQYDNVKLLHRLHPRRPRKSLHRRRPRFTCDNS